MSSATSESVVAPPNGPTDQPKKEKPKRNTLPAPSAEPPKMVRRRAKRNATERFYVVYEDKDDGQAQRILAKFPTIGQARKHFDLVVRVSGVPSNRVKIARFVIVD